MRQGAIILMGGDSRRMGRPKALLPFGPELLVQRVLRILGSVTDELILVSAPGQQLPPLPENVTVVHDERPGRGPLEGIQAGLRAAAGRAEACYISSCDVPLLNPDFVRRLFALMDADTEIVVPHDDKYFHPLAAVYRDRVLANVEDLLRQDRRRPFFLFESAQTKVIPTSELRDVDPDLRSLHNINTPEEYEAALALLSANESTS